MDDLFLSVLFIFYFRSCFFWCEDFRGVIGTSRNLICHLYTYLYLYYSVQSSVQPEKLFIFLVVEDLALRQIKLRNATILSIK